MTTVALFLHALAGKARKAPSPLVGEGGGGGSRGSLVLKVCRGTFDRSARPPSLTLPHKGGGDRNSDRLRRWL
jgi:hypothetical protein